MISFSLVPPSPIEVNRWVQITSEFGLLAYCQDGELIVVGVSLHELADYEAGHEGEAFRGAFSVVNGLLLAAVQLEQEPIFLNESDEVGLDLVGDGSLSLFD